MPVFPPSNGHKNFQLMYLLVRKKEQTPIGLQPLPIPLSAARFTLHIPLFLLIYHDDSSPLYMLMVMGYTTLEMSLNKMSTMVWVPFCWK